MLWGRQHALGETACSGGDCMLWGRQHALGETACSGGDSMLWGRQHALGDTACVLNEPVNGIILGTSTGYSKSYTQ